MANNGKERGKGNNRHNSPLDSHQEKPERDKPENEMQVKNEYNDNNNFRKLITGQLAKNVQEINIP
jgi:hypothetical protein